MPDLFGVVLRPVVTEKSSAAFAARKEYTFEAHPQATKRDIRAAVEELFGVRVIHVRTLQQRSKRRTMGRSEGRRPRWKKAFVRLHEEDSIDVFEG